MEGTRPDIVCGVAELSGKPVFKLSRRLVGKGYGKYLPRCRSIDRHKIIDIKKIRSRIVKIPAHKLNIAFARLKLRIIGIVGISVLYQIGYPIYKDGGFSAACTCKKQQGAIYCIDSLLLPVIHSFKIFCNYTAAKF